MRAAPSKCPHSRFRKAHWRSVGAPFALLTLSATAATAAAQSSPEEATASPGEPGVEQLYEQAKKALDEGRYAESCEHYRQLDRRVSMPLSWLGLARCDLRGRSFPAALKNARRAAKGCTVLTERATEPEVKAAFVACAREARNLEQVSERHAAAESMRQAGQERRACEAIRQLGTVEFVQPVWLDLARCDFEAEDFQASFQSANKARAQEDLPAQVKAADDLIARMTGAVFVYPAPGQPAPDALCGSPALQVDEQPTLLAQRATLAPGIHRWSLTAPGCGTAQGQFQVAAGPPLQVELHRLQPAPVQAANAALDESPLVKDPVMLGIGGALLGAGLVGAGYARFISYESQVDNFTAAGCSSVRTPACTDDRAQPIRERHDAEIRQLNRRLWLFGGTAAVGVLATLSSLRFRMPWYGDAGKTARKGRSPEAPSLTVGAFSLAPGISVLGSF